MHVVTPLPRVLDLLHLRKVCAQVLALLLCRAAALAAAAARAEAERYMTPNQRRAAALARAAEDEKARCAAGTHAATGLLPGFPLVLRSHLLPSRRKAAQRQRALNPSSHKSTSFHLWCQCVLKSQLVYPPLQAGSICGELGSRRLGARGPQVGDAGRRP